MKIFIVRNIISVLVFILSVMVLDILGCLNIYSVTVIFVIETIAMMIGAYLKVFKPIITMIKLVEETDWESDKIDFDKFDRISDDNTATFNLNILTKKYKYLVDIIEKKQGVVHNLNYLSEHDELTGCYNRVKLEKKRKKYESMCSISVIFLDVNNLKLMNDNFGHDAGDVLLKRASKQLSYWLIYGDIYRMGGDEFMVIIPDKTEEEVEELVKNWYDNNSPLNRTDDGFECKFAYGVATGYKFSGFVFDELMQEADEKMYIMKKELKNED